MAPKKRSAAANKDQSSALKLIIDNGPSSGQIHDFNPATVVRIGRVVRGNTLSIKDDGISSKHLMMKFDGNWIVTDLGSSNGTVLNGIQLEPNQPFVISDGDVIKLGEVTSIRVNLEGKGEIENVSRNTRRRGRNRVEELEAIHEESELGLGNLGVLGVENNLGIVSQNGADNEVKVEGKRTRGSKARNLKNESGEIDGKLETLMIKPDENVGKSDEAVVDEGNLRRNTSLRRTRSSKNDENLIEIGSESLGQIGLQRGNGVSTRRTRSSRNEGNFVELGVDLGVNVEKKTRKGAKGKAKLSINTSFEEEQNLEHEQREEEKGKSVGIEEGSNSGNRNLAVDLEKMMMREWIDYLDVFLPKQIIDETEEMISEMKQKAKRLHEFMLQKKNVK